MDRAPLPPHERSWRHPSEVGPTRVDVEADSHGRPLVLAAGTLAAIMLVVMVVALTPRSSGDPVAISATTTPALPRTTSAPPQADAQAVLSAARPPRLASFTPIPNAIAATTAFGEQSVAVAGSLPATDEPVLVRTESVTYRIAWGDLVFLPLGEGAVVFDQRGDIVARIEDGDLVLLVD